MRTKGLYVPYVPYNFVACVLLAVNVCGGVVNSGCIWSSNF